MYHCVFVRKTSRKILDLIHLLNDIFQWNINFGYIWIGFVYEPQEEFKIDNIVTLQQFTWSRTNSLTQISIQ